MSREQARVAAPALLEHAGHWRCWETWEHTLVTTLLSRERVGFCYYWEAWEQKPITAATVLGMDKLHCC